MVSKQTLIIVGAVLAVGVVVGAVAVALNKKQKPDDGGSSLKVGDACMFIFSASQDIPALCITSGTEVGFVGTVSSIDSGAGTAKVLWSGFTAASDTKVGPTCADADKQITIARFMLAAVGTESLYLGKAAGDKPTEPGFSALPAEPLLSKLKFVPKTSATGDDFCRLYPNDPSCYGGIEPINPFDY
jgi:hypothetical protein